MPARSVLFVALLTTAIGLPYMLSRAGLMGDGATASENQDATSAGGLESTAAASESETRLVSAETSKSQRPFWKFWEGTDDTDSSASSEGVPSLAERTKAAKFEGLGRPVDSQGLGGPPGVSLADALRFDVRPAWVTSNWARVTTHAGQGDLRGLRVPIVTGTDTHDFAGSLTYYFNSSHIVQRIQLHGLTADPEPLTALVQQRFGMKQYASASAGLYLGYHKEVPLGVMRISLPQVQDVARGSKYLVELELNTPSPGASLSRETLSKLHRLRKSSIL